MLRAGLAACLVGLALFALLAASSLADRRDAIRDARAAAAQVALVQQVHTSLVQADALATNAFLVGGLEPAQQRDGYEAGVATATQALTTAAGNASGGDLAGLETANAALARYTGLVESARANNRQGFPVGVAYLRQASQLLAGEVLPVLDDVSASSQQRVERALDRSGSARWGLWIGGVVALAALAACQVLLSSATRRTLNVGLVAATVLVLAGLIWGGASMASAASKAGDTHGGAYRDMTALASARIDAYSAKSAESLALINRGNGEAAEETWQSEHAAAVDALGGADDRATADDLLGDLDAYETVHMQIRDLDDGGDWDGAVAVATGFGEGSANEVFSVFDTASARALDGAAATVDGSLDDAAGPLGGSRVGVLIVLLLAAIATVWGFNLRLKEYR